LNCDVSGACPVARLTLLSRVPLVGIAGEHAIAGRLDASVVSTG
jgi:hypothetical protein